MLTSLSYQFTTDGASNFSRRRRVEKAEDLRIDSFCGPKLLLAVVPALADDAMQAHEFGVHRDVDESDRVEEFLA